MPPIDRAEFARLLADEGFDARSFERFVADLWAARGWETRVEGGTVVARKSGSTKVLRVCHGAADRQSTDTVRSADAVVTSGDGSSVRHVAGELGAELICVDDLHEMVLYAVDRETGGELLRRYFGRGVDGGGSREPTWRRSLPEDPTRRSKLTTILVIVLAAAVVLAGGVGPFPFAPELDGTSGVGVTPVADQTPTFAGKASVGTLHASEDGSPELASPALCGHSPEVASDSLLTALRTNDPRTDDGVRTVWRFGSPDFWWYAGSYSEFLRVMERPPFEHLVGFESLERRTVTTFGDTARLTVTVAGPQGERFTYAVALTRHSREPREGCWLVDGLAYRSNASGNASAPR